MIFQQYHYAPVLLLIKTNQFAFASLCHFNLTGAWTQLWPFWRNFFTCCTGSCHFNNFWCNSKENFVKMTTLPFQRYDHESVPYDCTAYWGCILRTFGKNQWEIKLYERYQSCFIYILVGAIRSDIDHHDYSFLTIPFETCRLTALNAHGHNETVWMTTVPGLWVKPLITNQTLWDVIACPCHWYLLLSLQWRHNERDGGPNHRRLHCLLNLVQAHIKENIKAPRHWPLWGEFTEFPAQRASNTEMFHLMTSSRQNTPHDNSRFSVMVATSKSLTWTSLLMIFLSPTISAFRV